MFDQELEDPEIIYSINGEDNTAWIIGCDSDVCEIFIPYSIIYESKEYTITCICERAFYDSEVKSIQFADNSKLQIIEKEAFLNSSIESLTIPSHVVELKDGWCRYTSNLKEINVSPDNKKYKTYENKIIIGKSNINQNNYDELLFCNRDTKNITIPNFIKHIKSYSFEDCNQLQTFEIPEDSQLQTIEDNSFTRSSIKNIKIPSQVIRIGKYAFFNCEQLQRIEFSPDSKLQIIDDYALDNSSIESITIPSEVIRIGKEAFYFCSYIQRIEFLIDSKLQEIEANTFSLSSIRRIKIPSEVKKIGESAFHSCFDLQQIEIHDNSKLQIIEKDAFCSSSIESLTIPSHVVELRDGWCCDTSKLKDVIVSPNNKKYKTYENKIIIGKSNINQNNYDELLFCNRDTKNITIPNFIKHIKSYSFEDCNQLQTLEIPEDSQLQTIEDNSFARSSIKNIKIPSQVIRIGKEAFFKCDQLQRIEFSPDSKLQIIDDYALDGLLNKSITIPSEVIQLGDCVFSDGIQIIEIQSNSKLKSINMISIINSKNAILMIPGHLNIIIIPINNEDYEE